MVLAPAVLRFSQIAQTIADSCSLCTDAIVGFRWWSQQQCVKFSSPPHSALSMVVIFWVAVCLVAYTYLGYPAWLWLRSRFSPQRNSYSTATSRVSIVVPIHNEERFVTRKVENLLRLDYPREQLEII